MPSNSRINSPEEIHDYIRVTNAGVWIILSAIIIFFAGLFIWIFTGSLEISFTAPVYADYEYDYRARAFLSFEDFSRVKSGLAVRISESNITGQIISVSPDVMSYNEIANKIGQHNAALMGLDNRAKFFETKIKFSRPVNHIAPAVFIIDTVRPVHFLLR